jgi:3alpha(or 20beta)-hydroxysteroid dehydrogenase
MEPLDDRIAIVTGAARGVGAAIAGRMIEVGARVVLGDIRHDAGVEVASRLGAAATYLPLDVTREEDRRRAVDAIVLRSLFAIGTLLFRDVGNTLVSTRNDG